MFPGGKPIFLMLCFDSPPLMRLKAFWSKGQQAMAFSSRRRRSCSGRHRKPSIFSAYRWYGSWSGVCPVQLPDWPDHGWFRPRRQERQNWDLAGWEVVRCCIQVQNRVLLLSAQFVIQGTISHFVDANTPARQVSVCLTFHGELDNVTSSL